MKAGIQRLSKDQLIAELAELKFPTKWNLKKLRYTGLRKSQPHVRSDADTDQRSKRFKLTRSRKDVRPNA